MTQIFIGPVRAASDKSGTHAPEWRLAKQHFISRNIEINHGRAYIGNCYLAVYIVVKVSASLRGNEWIPNGVS